MEEGFRLRWPASIDNVFNLILICLLIHLYYDQEPDPPSKFMSLSHDGITYCSCKIQACQGLVFPKGPGK